MFLDVKGSKKDKNTESVSERARREREARAAVKKKTGHAVVVQRFLRGRFSSWRHTKRVTSEVDAKLMDVVKISAILKLRGVQFVPPPASCMDLLKKARYVSGGGSTGQERIVLLCRHVLVPSLREPDIAKSVAAVLGVRLVGQLWRVVERELRSRLTLRRFTPARAVTDDARTTLVGSLRALAECTHHVMTNTVLRSGYDLLGTLTATLAKVDQEEHLRLGLKNPPAAAAAATGATSSSGGLVADDIALFVHSFATARGREDPYRTNVLLLTFLFSVPMLTYVTSAACLATLLGDDGFEGLVALTYVDDRFAEMTRDDLVMGVSSGLWITGNLSTLLQLAASLGSPTGTLVVLLSALHKLLHANFLPALVQGHSSVVLWTTKGVQSTGTSLPHALLQQIWTGLYGPTVLRGLARSALQPIRHHVTDVQDPNDAKEVEDGLNSTSLALTRQTMVQQTAEASAWFSTKWAKKLATGFSDSVGSLFRSDSHRDAGAHSATSVAAVAAEGSMTSDGYAEVGSSEPAPAPPAPPPLPNRQLLEASLRLWGLVLPHASFAAMDTMCWRGTSALAFSPGASDALWATCQFLGFDAFCDGFTASGGHLGSSGGSDLSVAAIAVMCAVLRMVLSTTDDVEIYTLHRPLSLLQILRVVRRLKMVLFRTVRDDPDALKEPTRPDPALWLRFGLVRSAAAVLRELHSRWVRKPFSSAALWEVEEASGKAVVAEIRTQTPLGMALLRVMPWCVQLRDRLRINRDVIDRERYSIQGGETMLAERTEGIVVKINKARVLDDGMRALDRVGVNIKERLIVRYVNQLGVAESGIDIGGLFKDFWVDLSAQVFDPNFGLFVETSDKFLYPNPSAPMLYDATELQRLYNFVGMILGKAIFENIVVGNQFAHFFLSFMGGRYNFMNLMDDLSTLDAELYKNLMFLKSYDGDVVDLCLTFSVTDDSFGGRREVDLVSGGSHIAVTSSNRIRYCTLIAKYYLHDRLEKQARAFFQGLYFVIQPELLSMFCAPELQVLISGASAGVDVDDFKAHCQYAAGYNTFHRNIVRFWKVVDGMEDDDRALLLKFVTSCERPPSLGFSALHPPFTVQYLDSQGDERLPSASTCFNVLKLPTYSSSKIMRQKLLLAIRSKSGFDLS